MPESLLRDKYSGPASTRRENLQHRLRNLLLLGAGTSLLVSALGKADHVTDRGSLMAVNEILDVQGNILGILSPTTTETRFLYDAA